MREAKSDIPLLACITSENSFAEKVASATNQIGLDFCLAKSAEMIFPRCDERPHHCLFVDGALGPDSLLECRDYQQRPLLFAVTPGDINTAFAAANIGAVGVVDRSKGSDDFAKAIAAAIQSDIEARNQEHEISIESPIYSRLTPRERQILVWLLRGEPNKRVASIMDIGLRTVEAGRAQVMKKLEVGSFAELIRFVTEKNISLAQRRQCVFQEILGVQNRRSTLATHWNQSKESGKLKPPRI